jgi:hypothetical protein
VGTSRRLLATVSCLRKDATLDCERRNTALEFVVLTPVERTVESGHARVSGVFVDVYRRVASIGSDDGTTTTQPSSPPIAACVGRPEQAICALATAITTSVRGQRSLRTRSVLMCQRPAVTQAKGATAIPGDVQVEARGRSDHACAIARPAPAPAKRKNRRTATTPWPSTSKHHFAGAYDPTEQHAAPDQSHQSSDGPVVHDPGNAHQKEPI